MLPDVNFQSLKMQTPGLPNLGGEVWEHALLRQNETKGSQREKLPGARAQGSGAHPSWGLWAAEQVGAGHGGQSKVPSQNTDAKGPPRSQVPSEPRPGHSW